MPGIAGQHGGVQPGDVDAELQRVGRGHAQQFAGAQGALQFPALLRQVAAPVGGDLVRPAPAPISSSRRWADSAVCSAPCRDRTKVRVRAPAATRSAIILAASAGADRRTGAPSWPSVPGTTAGSQSTKSAPGRGAPSSVTARTGRPINRSADAGRVGGRSPTRRRTPGRTRTSGPAGSTGAAPARRASRRRRGRRGTRRPPRTVSRRSTRAHRSCAGSSPRCSMSGLVSTQFACGAGPVPVVHRGVAVVGGGPEPRQLERFQGLAAGRRPAPWSAPGTARTARGSAGSAVSAGQLVGQRLAGRRSGGHHHVPAADGPARRPRA